MRLSVIGCGYLGAVHAAAMASIGHGVVGIDIDESKVAQLSLGNAPFFEPRLAELLTAGIESGRLRFTTDMSQARGAKVHFIAVGTPQQRDGYAADLSFVDAAIDGLLPYLTPGDIVAGKSTVPVGTAAGLAPRITDAAATLVWNPEFLREGWAVQDTIEPDRIVVGVERRGRDVSSRFARSTNPDSEVVDAELVDSEVVERGAERRAPDAEVVERGAERRDETPEPARHVDPAEVLREVYHTAVAADTPFLVTDFATSELVKVAANAFLATKISFINAMAEIAEVTGADVTLLADAIGHDPRIGRRFLGAGIGFGGGCLPKDIRAFAARAEELGRRESVSFLREVDAINLRRRDRAVDLVVGALGGSVFKKNITVLGASFKPHSDDIRDSPALDVAVRLRGLGAWVTITDPAALENARRQHPQLNYVDDRDEALRSADAVIIVTEWDEYRRQLSPEHAGSLVAGKIIIDGRNCLDAAAWRADGWDYYGMGRP